MNEQHPLGDSLLWLYYVSRDYVDAPDSPLVQMSKAKLRKVIGEIEREATALQNRAHARVLRRCAEEIENSLRSGSVPPEEVLRNCAAWYRAQADNYDPQPSADCPKCRKGRICTMHPRGR